MTPSEFDNLDHAAWAEAHEKETMTPPLTPEQKTRIRIALAKWMGWQLDNEGDWIHDEFSGIHLHTSHLSNPLTDLNDCHQIEVKLTDDQHKVFRRRLSDITRKSVHVIPAEENERPYISAPAEHRALALFLSLGLDKQP